MRAYNYSFLFVMTALAVVSVSGQTPVPASAPAARTTDLRIQKMTPMSVAEATEIVKGIQLTKTPTGGTKCMGDRTPCTAQQVQALKVVTTTVKSISNVKALSVTTDGTLVCTDMSDKPCPENDMAAMRTATYDLKQMKKL